MRHIQCIIDGKFYTEKKKKKTIRYFEAFEVREVMQIRNNFGSEHSKLRQV